MQLITRVTAVTQSKYNQYVYTVLELNRNLLASAKVMKLNRIWNNGLN